MNKLKAQTIKNQKELAHIKSLIKNESIKEKPYNDSLDFLDAVALYGRNDRDENIIMRNWSKEYCQLISNFNVAHTYTSGCSQIGKSLFHGLLFFYLVFKGYNAIWAYDTAGKIDKLVPALLKPIFTKWCELANIVLPPSKKNTNQLIQTQKGNAIFLHTNDPAKDKKGRSSVSTNIVGWRSEILFIDERSQHEESRVEPLFRRLDNSIMFGHKNGLKIRLKDSRQLGTPGNGNGIEKLITSAMYDFYPCTICESCNKEISLNPKGTLLKQSITEIDKKQHTTFLSANGKPLTWYHKDINEPTLTAFFACPHCENEISEDARALKSYFKCQKTGIKLSDFLARITEPTNYTVGITLSPLLRENSDNLAREIIETGLNSADPNDWQQQMLGLPSTTNQTAVTKEMFIRCVRSPKIADERRKPDYILCGIDFGRQQHWLSIIEFYLPKVNRSQSLKTYEKIDQTIRQVVFAGAVMQTEIKDILDKYDVQYGIIDNEPGITMAAKMCDDSGFLEMADQRSNLSDEYVKSTVFDGGQEFDCWKIHNIRFLTSVLNNFLLIAPDGYPLYRFPDDWESWFNNESEISPLRHFISPKYNPATEKWERTDHIDDIYYSTMFCEVAFRLQLESGGMIGYW